MTRPSKRSQSVTPFLVMEILERAQRLQLQGADVIHMDVGEPDFATPDPVSQAGVQAILAGHTRYTHSLGIPALREAIAERYNRDYGVSVTADRVVVTTGSSAALTLVFAALLDVDDEIVVPDPGYPCYANIARTLGARPRLVRVGAADGFFYDPERVGAQAAGARAVMVGSPANPTGTIIDDRAFRSVIATGIPVISDEIYHGLVYEGRARSVLELTDDGFVVGGFSKRYAMTGWRIGFAIVPRGFVRTVQTLAQNLYISPADFPQHAALEALSVDTLADTMLPQYQQRRDVLLSGLRALGLPVPAVPQGAFYVFADAGAYSGDSLALSIDILDRTHVAVAPGIDFGPHGEGFLRFSYATGLDRIHEALERLDGYFAGR